MAKGVDGIGLAALGLGSALMYAGIKGYSLLAVVENLVTGKPIMTNVTMVQPLTTDAPATTTPEESTPQAATGSNQAIGIGLAAGYGWIGSEWTALQTLWTKESSWNNHANNSSSGAYGIPQALPYTKMPKAAWPESAGGTSDATAQIQWGLSYIKGRYGNPSKALAFHLQNNWY
jgi:hypothetical protein